MLNSRFLLVFSNVQKAIDKDSILEKIFPSGWKPFVVQILAMVVLVLAFFIFFFKPVRKILDARKEKMMSDVTEAHKKNASAQTLLTEAEGRIRDSKTEAVAIVENARKEAEAIKEQTIAKAKAEAIRIKKDAEKDIEMSKKQAQDDINKSIIEVALKASEKVLEREVDSKDNEKLIGDFLEEMNK